VTGSPLRRHMSESGASGAMRQKIPSPTAQPASKTSARRLTRMPGSRLCRRSRLAFVGAAQPACPIVEVHSLSSNECNTVATESHNRLQSQHLSLQSIARGHQESAYQGFGRRQSHYWNMRWTPNPHCVCSAAPYRAQSRSTQPNTNTRPRCGQKASCRPLNLPWLSFRIRSGSAAIRLPRTCRGV